MKLPAIIISAIWLDGVGTGLLIGLAFASHIEGRGFWSYIPYVLPLLVVLGMFVVMLRRVMREAALRRND